MLPDTELKSPHVNRGLALWKNGCAWSVPFHPYVWTHIHLLNQSTPSTDNLQYLQQNHKSTDKHLIFIKRLQFINSPSLGPTGLHHLLAIGESRHREVQVLDGMMRAWFRNCLITFPSNIGCVAPKSITTTRYRWWWWPCALDVGAPNKPWSDLMRLWVADWLAKR